MSDVLTKDQHSYCMSRIGGKNTRPELVVRSLVHRIGYRFRLHRSDLPSKPDLVLPRHNKVIFVHGCFWHRHPRCRYTTTPKTRTAFWQEKFEQNKKRDRRTPRQLRKLGWDVLVAWECETKDPQRLVRRLKKFLSHHA